MELAHSAKTQKPLKREGVRIGNFLVLALVDTGAVEKQVGKLEVKNYHVQKTPHFVAAKKPCSDEIVLLHTFTQETIDADLICLIEHELGPLGFITSERIFGAILFGILASTFSSPRHQPTIWLRFCINTLEKLRIYMNLPVPKLPENSYIIPFATIYHRIAELLVGESFLDVGSSFGFLPILLTEYKLELSALACDNNPDAITLSSTLAHAVSSHPINFILQDVLAPTFPTIGRFDTTTVIHVLEHLTEDQLPQALKHLLQVTRHRLIIAVPYEQEATEVYGHRQLFTPEKLNFWGKWCVQHMPDRGRYWCEDVAGGMLIVEMD
ncbi:MAG TPA: class I SAM-dependent methyltransferase [Ktedonobacteraceae bacterium]|nr:class I SAM-dependent methyltransferase [Ktedonobacteraceae bacterium]